MRRTQALVGYPGGRHLYALLKAQYYWQGMVRDCIRVCATALPCQLEQAKFRDPKYLLPTCKDTVPFHTWCRLGDGFGSSQALW